MKKFEFEGENYIYHNGKFYDETYQELCLKTLNKVTEYFFSNKICEKMNKAELIDHIKMLKQAKQYAKSIKAIGVGFVKFDDLEFIKFCMPLLTSNFRALGQYNKAISVATEYLKKCNCGSVALYTSLGAAYCDVKDYKNAEKCAKIAYARQGGSMGAATELTMLYKRIKREQGIFED